MRVHYIGVCVIECTMPELVMPTGKNSNVKNPLCDTF